MTATTTITCDGCGKAIIGDDYVRAQVFISGVSGPSLPPEPAGKADFCHDCEATLHLSAARRGFMLQGTVTADLIRAIVREEMKGES